VPDENPSGLGVTEFNLRFPGQYFDKETNLHYNYFRDYDPVLGRYEQSDPIGVAVFRTLAFQGLRNVQFLPLEMAAALYSTNPRLNQIYTYVNGRPLSSVDQMGLQQESPSMWEIRQGYWNIDPKADCQFSCSAKFFRALVLDDAVIHGAGHPLKLTTTTMGWLSVAGVGLAVMGDYECMKQCRPLIGACKPLDVNSLPPPATFGASLGRRLGYGP
jgi:RHS repeat-associated protein